MVTADKLVSTTYNNVTQTGITQDFPAFFVKRNVNTTGGSLGWTNSALQAYTVAQGTGCQNFEWAFLAHVDNSQTGPAQNCASYAQMKIMASGVSPSFAFASELLDDSLENNPAAGRVGAEVAFQTSGGDVNSNRVMVDVVPKKSPVAGSTPATITYGVRVGRNNQEAGNVSLTNAIAILGQTTYGLYMNLESSSYAIQLRGGSQFGLDFALLTAPSAAIRLAAGHRISMEVTSQYQLTFANVNPYGTIQLLQSGTPRVSFGLSPSSAAVFLQGVRRLSSECFNHPSYTTATRPSAAVCGVGATIVVTDPPGGVPTIAISDGSAWRNLLVS